MFGCIFCDYYFFNITKFDDNDSTMFRDRDWVKTCYIKPFAIAKSPFVKSIFFNKKWIHPILKMDHWIQ